MYTNKKDGGEQWYASSKDGSRTELRNYSPLPENNARMRLDTAFIGQLESESSNRTKSEFYSKHGGSRSSSLSVIIIIDRPSYTRLSTVGDRAFPVAADRVWNELTTPRHVCVFHARFLPSSKDSSFIIIISSSSS